MGCKEYDKLNVKRVKLAKELKLIEKSYKKAERDMFDLAVTEINEWLESYCLNNGGAFKSAHMTSGDNYLHEFHVCERKIHPNRHEPAFDFHIIISSTSVKITSGMYGHYDVWETRPSNTYCIESDKPLIYILGRLDKYGEFIQAHLVGRQSHTNYKECYC